MADDKKPQVEVGRWDEKGRRPKGAPQTRLEHLEALAWILDSSIPVPGTSLRVGLDSVIGLIPVIGDIIGTAISTYILVLAARQGVPRVTLLRMGFNVSVEAVVGMIPFAGDLFDAAWKANLKNVALLRAHVENPSRAHKTDWIFAGIFLVFAAAVLAGAAWGGIFLGRKLVGLFS
jgi:hypothetical protein